MNKIISCPISGDLIDGNGPRAVAAQVAVLLLAWVGTGQGLLIPVVLCIDFALRGLHTQRFPLRNLSPLRFIARLLLSALKTTPRPTDYAPKRFAAQLGLLFSLLLLGSQLLGLPMVGYAIAIPFWVCASLEATFNFCVGCRMYQLLQMVRPPQAT